jgi:hypothetical protein
MQSQRQFFLRVWIVALAVSLAGGVIALRPDSALRTLWRSRQIALHSDELSDRALRDGGHLRAVAPEAPSSDEEAQAYVIRLQAVRNDIARAHRRAWRRLAMFAAIMLIIPPGLAALSLAGRHIAGSRLLTQRLRAH